MSLLIIFFLGEYIIKKNFSSQRSQPTPLAEAPGGGVAGIAKSMPLDRQKAPPW